MRKIKYSPEIKKELLDSAENWKEVYQAALDAYEALHLKTKIGIDEVDNNVDAETFLREIVYQESPLKDLPIEPEAAKKMIKLPEGWREFAKAKEKLRTMLMTAKPNGTLEKIRQDKKGDKVYISSDLDAFAEAQASVFTTTPEQDEIYDFFKDFSEKLKKLQEKYPNPNRVFFSESLNSRGIIKTWVNFKTQVREFSFHPEEILR